MNKRLKVSLEMERRFKEEIMQYYTEQFDETIGELKAQLLFDFFCESIAPTYYNLGIKDTVAFISDKMDDVYHLEL